MKNITITLDEETAAWVRVCAAQKNVSLSHFVGELLRDRMRESHDYEGAMRGFLAEKPVKLKKPGERYLTRDEALHGRNAQGLSCSGRRARVPGHLAGRAQARVAQPMKINEKA